MISRLHHAETRTNRPASGVVKASLQSRARRLGGKTYHRILGKMLFEPWFITPAKYSSMMQQLRSHLTSDKGPVRLGPSRLQEPDEWQDAEGEDECEPVGNQGDIQAGYGICIIPVYGIIGKKLSWLEMFCGGCDVDLISAALTEADEDADIHTIILDFDSPGGLYTGLPELAAQIRDVAKRKTVISYSEVECCSAAYWLGCNAGEFYCTHSATIGSIGGFIAGIDTSKEWENIGWALELFKSGKNKAMGLDGKPWQESEREFLQALVDKECAEFYDVVRKGRPNIAAEPIETANFYDGDQAVKQGLVDRNVRDLREVIDAALASHYSEALAIA